MITMAQPNTKPVIAKPSPSVVFGLRRISARVKRWRGGRMILRWTVAALADAATRFRRVTGAREGMTPLVRGLKDHENVLATAAPRKKAASDRPV